MKLSNFGMLHHVSIRTDSLLIACCCELGKIYTLKEYRSTYTNNNYASYCEEHSNNNSGYRLGRGIQAWDTPKRVRMPSKIGRRIKRSNPKGWPENTTAIQFAVVCHTFAFAAASVFSVALLWVQLPFTATTHMGMYICVCLDTEEYTSTLANTGDDERDTRNQIWWVYREHKHGFGRIKRALRALFWDLEVS